MGGGGERERTCCLHIFTMPSYFNQPCLVLDLLEASLNQEILLIQAFKGAGGIVLLMYCYILLHAILVTMLEH